MVACETFLGDSHRIGLGSDIVIDVNKYKIGAGSKVDLSKLSTDDKSLYKKGKKKGLKELAALNERLESLQELLYASKKHRMLIVLQAMDTAGKDSTIRHVFDGVNPQGVKVASFKKPTEEELSHDYLWRVHKHTPAKGEISIFNRSHYEDVLVVRVRNIVKRSVWQKRFKHINAFEEMLADEGVTVLKFFLHISKEEQRERLQERIDIKEKRWKFAHGDLEERKLWSTYQKAYGDMMSKTSQKHAPWYVIPGDSKWYRNLVISKILVKKLESFKMKYPNPEKGLAGLIVK